MYWHTCSSGGGVPPSVHALTKNSEQVNDITNKIKEIIFLVFKVIKALYFSHNKIKTFLNFSHLAKKQRSVQGYIFKFVVFFNSNGTNCVKIS